MSVTREEVLACLKTIQAPSGIDLVEAGLVRALSVTDGAVRFVMEVSSPAPFEPAKAEAEQAKAAEEVESAQAEAARPLLMRIAEWQQKRGREASQARR